MQRNTDFHFTPAAREKLATLLPDNAAAIDMLERLCAQHKKREQNFEDEPSLAEIRFALRPVQRALARLFDALEKMPDSPKVVSMVGHSLDTKLKRRKKGGP